MGEILLFAIIALIVLGPEKLPEAARFTGRWYGKIKRLMSNVQNDLDRELRLSELQQQMQQELVKIQQLEQQMQVKLQRVDDEHLSLKNATHVVADQLQHYQPCLSLHKAPFIDPSHRLPPSHIKLKTAV